ncbi:hypothetical protein Acr_25g0003130 [Actinidia rufa]|uniref:Uncharacterized protein n=1 Tax=Actinidia rufa TaxID=165716 RepID=A0A7J0GZE7_9ERIC|nr:hypothetical protein Acr_25g0003130 [Actinidia rufa]
MTFPSDPGSHYQAMYQQFMAGEITSEHLALMPYNVSVHTEIKTREDANGNEKKIVRVENNEGIFIEKWRVRIQHKVATTSSRSCMDWATGRARVLRKTTKTVVNETNLSSIAALHWLLEFQQLYYYSN